MNRSVVLTILIVLALLAGAAGLGYFAYTTGYAQGLVQSGKIELVAPGTQNGPGVPFGYGPGFHAFGWGRWGGPFAFLRCLIPLLFFFLFFGLIRFLFWRPWGWHARSGWRGGPWDKEGVPPFFEEWHKRTHEAKASPPSE